jgi:tetratricopeptide (TPR) repeat protein
MPQDGAPKYELLADNDLARQALAAWKLERFPEAVALLLCLCERYTERSEPIPAAPLAFYAACLARVGRLKEAVDTCRLAAKRDSRNPIVQLNLARVYLAAGSRRRALEALNRGLDGAPKNPDLRALEVEMGQRHRPVIGFLSRDNPVNIALGRARYRLFQSNRTEAER